MNTHKILNTRIRNTLSILACFIFCISFPVQAKRIALVMGNDNYTSVSKLQKAGNDATAMARELKAAGFTVQLHRDLNFSVPWIGLRVVRDY